MTELPIYLQLLALLYRNAG